MAAVVTLTFLLRLKRERVAVVAGGEEGSAGAAFLLSLPLTVLSVVLTVRATRDDRPAMAACFGRAGGTNEAGAEKTQRQISGVSAAQNPRSKHPKQVAPTKLRLPVGGYNDCGIRLHRLTSVLFQTAGAELTCPLADVTDLVTCEDMVSISQCPLVVQQSLPSA